MADIAHCSVGRGKSLDTRDLDCEFRALSATLKYDSNKNLTKDSREKVNNFIKGLLPTSQTWDVNYIRSTMSLVGMGLKRQLVSNDYELVFDLKKNPQSNESFKMRLFTKDKTVTFGPYRNDAIRLDKFEEEFKKIQKEESRTIKFPTVNY
jgi:hypothetical protein